MDLSPQPPLLRGEGEPNEVLRKQRFIRAVIARTTPSRHPHSEEAGVKVGQTFLSARLAILLRKT